MLFYRSRSSGTRLSHRAARATSLAALALYPAGALVADQGPNLPIRMTGFALIAASLLCVAVLMGSPLQRIVGEQISRLDEYEVKLRSRAIGSSYSCLTVLALLAVLYCAIASTAGAWVPKNYDEFNGLFWGVFLYASVLPGAFLAWQIDDSEAAGDEDSL